ncbi:MAG: CehA/McbA family metallohydrolase [bacterium]
MGRGDPFSAGGKWYRGCLHTHTTRSDGALPPEGVARWYRDKGYDFISITDHNVFTDVGGLSDGDFLVLPGAELSGRDEESGVEHHIIAAGTLSPVILDKDPSPQELIDRIRGCGGEAIVAHPYWSGSTVRDLSELRDHVGVEVFNTSAFVEDGRGFSNVHWDQLLDMGICTWGLAVDDSHWKRSDAGGGWIVLRASELSREAILRSLREGLFYATSGPQILDLRLEGDTVKVECSPVKAVSFLHQMGKGVKLRPSSEELLTSGEYKLKGHERYIRVECIDGEGRCAWSNPIFPHTP